MKTRAEDNARKLGLIWGETGRDFNDLHNPPYVWIASDENNSWAFAQGYAQGRAQRCNDGEGFNMADYTAEEYYDMFV